MRRWWERFLEWVYGRLLERHTDRVVYRIDRMVEEARKDAVLARMDMLVRLTAVTAELETLRHETAQEQHSIQARLQQICTLLFGKNGQEWEGKLSRAPKEFTYDERQ